jgi:hypothetical protein
MYKTFFSRFRTILENMKNNDNGGVITRFRASINYFQNDAELKDLIHKITRPNLNDNRFREKLNDGYDE